MSTKLSMLSPATQAHAQQPAPGDEERIFEDKFSEMAYQAFDSKFPNYVDYIVTFKILDSNLENGSAVGAFILEFEGEFLYIPSVLMDNQLKPFDMMYVKSKDIFLPLSEEWIEEVSKVSLSAMGEGTELPETVATDVDIRNVIVPPTTGRYSYASADISPRNRLEADASYPLALRLHKVANLPPFPGEAEEAQAGGGVDPDMWAMFVEQFSRIHQLSPGQALDNGIMDVDALAKMYKSHVKTWNTPIEQAAPAAMDAGMGMPKQASVGRTLGSKVDDFIGVVGRGAGGGGLLGGVHAAASDDLGDVPRSAIRGAIGGAVGAPMGAAVGRGVGIRSPKIDVDAGKLLGGIIGGGGGAWAMVHDKSQLPVIDKGIAPSQYQDPYAAYYGVRTASYNPEQGLKDMFKHAQESKKYKNALPEFLGNAPNNVKTAFANVLRKNPRLLKQAADLYGKETLVKALKHKTAGTVSSGGGALYIADKSTSPKDLHKSFGAAAPEAFNGVLLRGYYFRDTRPKLNLAVQTQEYHDFHDARESGVYLLHKPEGAPVPALVIPNPIDLTCDDDRIFYPEDGKKVSPVKNRVPMDKDKPEPHSASSEVQHAEPEDTRNRKLTRLAILENGNYIKSECLMGEMVAELALKGSEVFRRVMSDGRAAPTKGVGCFVAKKGTNYIGTCPVEILSVSTGTDGVVTGKLAYRSGFSTKKFIIDPRTPLNRVMRPRNKDFVVIPASWKWVPLKEEEKAESFISGAKMFSDFVVEKLNSMGVTEAVARKAGQSMYAVSGGRTMNRKDALKKLAEDYYIHASAAEAMLKIAEHESVCRAYVLPVTKVASVVDFIKTAQGQMPPGEMEQMPPGMQPPPGEMEQMPPGMGEQMPPGMDQQMAPPQPDPTMAVAQAFGETTQGLQQAMEQLQGQLGVLQMVQQRAMQIQAEQMGMDPSEVMGPEEEMPMDPEMQGMDPSMEGMDPEMQGMEPGMEGMPPQEEEPPLPIMRSESPSAEEIEQSVSPAFLEQAANFNDAGAFDAGAIASMSKDPSLKNTSSQYIANMEDSVDELGRTLLTMYMQETDLKERIGDNAFVELEEQLRNTFQGLGKLVLSLSQNTAILDEDNAAA
jgi:hypothetical protein